MVFENSEIPDHLKPIYLLVLNDKVKDDFYTICYKWHFDDMILMQQALSDRSLIEQIYMPNGGI